MESYIESKKKLYNIILEFLNESEEINQRSFTKFIRDMRKYQFDGDREEMTQFLLIIKSISDHHHRDKNFIQKVKEILQHYQAQIKQTLSNEEIFYIFENNYIVYKIESNGNRYCHFFYPELEQLKGEEMKFIKEDILKHDPTAFEGFENKRQEGENESYICSLIRKDSVVEFISYINRNKISFSSVIKPSIFETNSFLIDNKDTTLIEYSAFFGSIQIFRFLLMNNVELTPSLWLYSIHLLESNQIDPTEFVNSNKDNGYLSCLIESIKCHHNDFSEYIKNNLIQEQEIKTIWMKEETISSILKYHNYLYFQTDMIKEKGFFYLCFYNYNELVELLLKEKEEEIKKKIIISTIIIQ